MHRQIGPWALFCAHGGQTGREWSDLGVFGGRPARSCGSSSDEGKSHGMTDSAGSGPFDRSTSGVIPTTPEAFDRLDISLLEAMMTQRAVRRLLPDPVDDAIVLKCIELGLAAPTGSNGQNWEFVVVKDQKIKEQLAARYRESWSVYGSLGRRLAGDDESMSKIMRAVMAGRPLRRDSSVARALPPWRRPRRTRAVPARATRGRVVILRLHLPECAEHLAGGAGHGVGRLAHHLAVVERYLGPENPRPAAVGHAMLRGAVGLAAGPLGPTTRKPVEQVVHLDTYGNRTWLDT